MIERFAIIIGSMKSGATTLANTLGRHPAVALANPKEPGCFAFDETHARGPDWYEGLFRFDPAHRRRRAPGMGNRDLILRTKHPRRRSAGGL